MESARSTALGALATIGLVASLTSTAAAPAQGRAAAPLCEGERATIVGTAGGETLRGTDRRDVIVSRGGNDTIRGRGGDAGADGFSSYSSRSVQIHGGDGNDSASLHVTKDPGTVIDPGAGHDDLTLGSDLSGHVAARTWVHADAGAGTIRIGDGAIGELGSGRT